MCMPHDKVVISPAGYRLDVRPFPLTAPEILAGCIVPAGARYPVCDGESDAGMEQSPQPHGLPAAYDLRHHPVTDIVPGQSVSVMEVDARTVPLHIQGFPVYAASEGVTDERADREIVVSREVVDLDAPFGQSLNRGEDPQAGRGDNVPVLVPEIVEIAEDIEPLAVGAHLLEQVEKTDLLRGFLGGRLRAEMDIGDEVECSHGVARVMYACNASK